MTPTRYPTWRSLAFAIGIIQLLGLALNLVSSGFRTPHLASVEDRTGLLWFTLLLGGAALMSRRPALGYSVFGAGWLVGSVCVLVLTPRRTEILPVIAAFAMLGILYSVLGVKQLAADRG